MKNFTKKFTALLVALTITFSANADSDNDDLSTEDLAEQIEQLQNSIKSLKAQVDQIDKAEQPAKSESLYKPKMYGVVMAALNVSTDNGLTRFNVRNSRFGIKGNATKNFYYGVQIDFHNQGSVSVLDSYVGYKYGNFKLNLGQQQTKISEDYERGPSSNLFTTRSISAVYGTSYFGTNSDGDYSKTLGSRDIGAYATYSLKCDTPITISAGAFNGTGINNPDWDNVINYIGRITVGGKQGIFAGASFYGGKTPLDQSIKIYTGEVRYNNDEFFAEAIFQNRTLTEDNQDQSLNMVVVQGYYNIATPKSTLFQNIAPTLRWDYGGDVGYVNLMSEIDSSATDYLQFIDVHRISAALNFNLAGSKLRSRIALGYEKIFTSTTLADTSINPLLHDKVTFAFIAAF